MKVGDFQRLKEQAARASREMDLAQGEKNALLQRLKKEFGCNTLADAERLLKKLKKELQRENQQLDRHLNRLEEVLRTSQTN